MLSTCPDCSKATWVWAQPAVDGLWGAQPCCGSKLSPTAAAPCGYVRWKARADTPHTAEMCSHHPKGNDSESRKELSCSQPSCRGRRQQACRAQNGASHSTSGSAPHRVRASPPTNPRMGIRRAPSRGQWTGTRAPPKRAIAESPRFQQGPQSQWGISSWDNPQHLPVPPDTALEHQEPSGLPPVRQQPQDMAASKSCSHMAPRQEEARQEHCAYGPQQPARSRGQASGACHGTSSPICLSSPLHAPFAAHLRSHMAERKLQRRRRRRRSPTTIAAQAHSPAWRRCHSPTGTGLVNAHSAATTPQLPPHLHAPEPPPCSVSYLFCL